MLKTVLLKFSGPLQSWGTGSHFETRHTDAYPSKSGVIGMVAAGLGYRRDEDEKISRLNNLGFAVRIDQPGEILRDYHTVKKYKDNGSIERTYVTNRYYLQDAVFVVALCSEEEEMIEKVEVAVTHPYFSQFLGRRSTPPTMDLFLGKENKDAITALKECPWQAAEWYKKKNTNRLWIMADEALLGIGCTHVRNDEVVSFSQINGRRFCPRKEARLVVDVAIPDKEKEHDAFSVIGEM